MIPVKHGHSQTVVPESLLLPCRQLPVRPGPGPGATGYKATPAGFVSTSSRSICSAEMLLPISAPTLRQSASTNLATSKYPSTSIRPNLRLEAGPLYPAKADPGCRFPALCGTDNSSISHRSLLVPGLVPVRCG